MLKLSSTIALVVGIAAAVMVSIPRFKATTDSPSPVETVGVGEQGIIIIGRNDPNFDKLIAEHRAGSSQTTGGAVDPYSVLVVNNAGQSIAACIVKWEIQNRDGRKVTHSSAQAGTLTTISERGSARLSEYISPKDLRVFSLISSLNNSEPRFRMDGGRPDLAQQFSESVKVTVSIDGVLFVDGTFIGPDTMNYFARLSTEMDAERDLYAELSQLISTAAEPKATVDRIEILAKGESNSAELPAGKDPRYSVMKKRHASRLLALRKASGDEAVLEVIKTEVSKPRVVLRKG